LLFFARIATTLRPSRFLILAFTAKYAKEAAKIAEKKRQPYKLHHYQAKKGSIAV
jgi:hypothetical protein